jgi:hypothetical protein
MEQVFIIVVALYWDHFNAYVSEMLSTMEKPLSSLLALCPAGKALGRGQFGTTRIGVCKRTGKSYAIKSILRSSLVGMEEITGGK